MKLLDRAPEVLWRNYWTMWRYYHRYTVEGLEHVVRPDAVLIAGYHGRPVAFDLAMLSLEIQERLGYLPHGIFHSGWDSNPVLRFVAKGLGAVTSDGPELAAAVARGEHIMVTPGGSLEATRPWTTRYRVRWGQRIGYLKLAIKYRLPIVPVAARGVDDAFCGLIDGYAWGRRLHLPFRMDLTLFLGLGGIWPFALPFPVRFRQLIGEAIHLPPELDAEDNETLFVWHRVVTGRVQALLDRLVE